MTAAEEFFANHGAPQAGALVALVRADRHGDAADLIETLDADLLGAVALMLAMAVCELAPKETSR